MTQILIFWLYELSINILFTYGQHTKIAKSAPTQNLWPPPKAMKSVDEPLKPIPYLLTVSKLREN